MLIYKGFGIFNTSSTPSGGESPSYDVDAQDYFTRAEALGGSFDLSSINVSYTESYIKTAISDFITTCKSDGTWTKVTELYLMSGVTFAGLTAKLKYNVTSTLTNNGFVAGDYLAAGSGAGLTGDGSSDIGSNLPFSELDFNAYGYGYYQIAVGSGTTIPMHWVNSTNEIVDYGASTFSFRIDGNSLSTGFIAQGVLLGTKRSSGDVEVYVNGSSNATGAATSTAPTSNLTLYSRGGTGLYSNGKFTSFFVITGFSDTDASNFSSALNTLMTAFGCNVY